MEIFRRQDLVSNQTQPIVAEFSDFSENLERRNVKKGDILHAGVQSNPTSAMETFKVQLPTSFVTKKGICKFFSGYNSLATKLVIHFLICPLRNCANPHFKCRS